MNSTPALLTRCFALILVLGWGSVSHAGAQQTPPSVAARQQLAQASIPFTEQAFLAYCEDEDQAVVALFLDAGAKTENQAPGPASRPLSQGDCDKARRRSAS